MLVLWPAARRSLVQILLGTFPCGVCRFSECIIFGNLLPPEIIMHHLLIGDSKYTLGMSVSMHGY